jgi:murein DD-endopeptidase MepM/ murein hydrolase activator NlpD
VPRRRRVLVAALAAVAAAVLGGSALADVPPIVTVPEPTTTGPPTTTGSPIPTPTTSPRSAPSSTSPPAATPTTVAGAPPPTDTDVAGQPGVVPPEYRALIASVVRSAPNSTDGLIKDLEALAPFGVTPQQAALIGFGHFPVAGPTRFTDDWWMPRFTPTFHLHQGTDLFAASGTPVRAPFDGVLKFGDEPVGGLAAYVTMPDGTFFYAAHLSAFGAGFSPGAAVKQGDVVGFVGDTGDAVGGAPHVHFEIHPQGGPAIDPKPFLDQWLADARAHVPDLVAAYRATRATTVADGGHRFDVAADWFAAPAASSGGPLGWASALSPTGAAVRVAEVQAGDIGAWLSWSGIAEAARLRAAASAQAALARLTPTRLRGFF